MVPSLEAEQGLMATIRNGQFGWLNDAYATGVSLPPLFQSISENLSFDIENSTIRQFLILLS